MQMQFRFLKWPSGCILWFSGHLCHPPLTWCTSSWDCCFDRILTTGPRKRSNAPFTQETAWARRVHLPCLWLLAHKQQHLMSSLGSLCLQSLWPTGHPVWHLYGTGGTASPAGWEFRVLKDPGWDPQVPSGADKPHLSQKWNSTKADPVVVKTAHPALMVREAPSEGWSAENPTPRQQTAGSHTDQVCPDTRKAPSHLHSPAPAKGHLALLWAQHGAAVVIATRDSMRQEACFSGQSPPWGWETCWPPPSDRRGQGLRERSWLATS